MENLQAGVLIVNVIILGMQLYMNAKINELKVWTLENFEKRRAT